MPSPEPQVKQLLEQVVSDFPRFKRDLEKRFSRRGSERKVELSLKPSVPVTAIPTFAENVVRPITPMLRARFAFASSISPQVRSGLVLTRWRTRSKALQFKRRLRHIVNTGTSRHQCCSLIAN